MSSNKTQSPRLFVPLIILGIFLLIAAVVIFILGKFIFAGLLALLGAVLSLGKQVSENEKLQL